MKIRWPGLKAAVTQGEADRFVREELETAWLRGWASHKRFGEDPDSSVTEQLAADYAERVVGGSTRPEKP